MKIEFKHIVESLSESGLVSTEVHRLTDRMVNAEANRQAEQTYRRVQEQANAIFAKVLEGAP